MADRPDPYVRKDPNDIIRSGDWNDLQIQAREHILRHTHTGRKDDGSLIPGAGIDPAAEVSVRTLATSGNLSVGGDLKVNGKALLGDIADLLASVKGLQDDKLSRTGGSVSGTLKVSSNLLVDGNVGIGTETPARKFQIGPDVDGLGFELAQRASPNVGVIRFGDNTGWKLHFGRSRERPNGELNSGLSGLLMTIKDNGYVGIGTETPRAKLEVIGDLNVTDGFVRRISMATGLGPSDETDNGQIVSRALTINKVYAETAIRILYCDNFRVRSGSENKEGAASWEIRIDGRSSPSGVIRYDRYSVSGNQHQQATVIGYAQGISPGTHTIGVWVGPVSGYAICDAYTGWASSRWTLEAQEVWI
jgi:hypothetical protein